MKMTGNSFIETSFLLSSYKLNEQEGRILSKDPCEDKGYEWSLSTFDSERDERKPIEIELRGLTREIYI